MSGRYHHAMRAAALGMALLMSGLLATDKTASGQTSQGSGAPSVPTTLNGVPVLRGAELERLIASVRPTAEEERYLEVPWRTNLAAAIQEAVEQKKPLFIWAMSGNPLGCT